MARRPRGATPHYVDAHVGRRIRLRRKAARLSMEALAAELSITHQQLQKYETGASRISVSMLFEIAAALQASVADFFEGLPSPAAAAAAGRRMDGQFERFLASPGGAELMLAFVRLPEAFQLPFVAMAQAAATLEPCADIEAELTGRPAD